MSLSNLAVLSMALGYLPKAPDSLPGLFNIYGGSSVWYFPLIKSNSLKRSISIQLEHFNSIGISPLMGLISLSIDTWLILPVIYACLKD